MEDVSLVFVLALVTFGGFIAFGAFQLLQVRKQQKKNTKSKLNNWIEREET